MSAARFERTFTQCRDKIKKLKAEYRAIVNKKHKKTGEDRTEWEFFEPLDDIIGHKLATHPPLVIDALGGDLGIDSEDNSELEEVQSNDVDDSSASVGSNDTSNTSVTDGNDSTPGPSNPCSSQKPELRAKSRAKKRPPSKSDKVEVMMHDLVDKVLEASKASELKLMELEEKRMKLEEKQLEREDSQRKEEREFQMRMFQMLMMGSYQSSMPSQLEEMRAPGYSPLQGLPPMHRPPPMQGLPGSPMPRPQREDGAYSFYDPDL